MKNILISTFVLLSVAALSFWWGSTSRRPNPSLSDIPVSSAPVSNPSVSNPSVSNPSVSNPSVSNPSVSNPSETTASSSSNSATNSEISQEDTTLSASPPPSTGFDSSEERIINVYERSAASVVSVVVRSTVYSFFSTFEQEGEGSGFVIDNAGHIITNFHVIDGAERIDVVFADGSSHPASVRGKDPSNDLALLAINTPREQTNFQPLPLGDGTALRVGQRTIAIGNPFGYFGQTLTTGVISALNRSIKGQDGSHSQNSTTIYDIIQTDAAINRGNSGGPLLNSSGEVIGINTAIFSPSGTNTGVGFAISVETLKRVLPDLMTLGYYRNPTLGVRAGYALDGTIARELGLPREQGLLLVSLAADSPLLEHAIKGAQEQRFLRGQTIYLGGDILLALDDYAISSARELRDIIVNNYLVGDEVTLKVLHSQTNGTWREETVQVQLQAE